MANIAKTFTFVNSQPADATQVNKNFDDIITGVGDLTTLRPTVASLGLDADLTTLALPANTTISAAGAELINDANVAAQLVTLGTAAYSEAAWTPVLASFTIVGADPALVGKYKRIGNLVFIELTIHAGAGGNTSVACVGGTSVLQGYPAIAGGSNAIVSGSSLNADNLGTSRLPYIPAFSAKAVDLYFTATYYV